jgi:hypothetical protein
MGLGWDSDGTRIGLREDAERTQSGREEDGSNFSPSSGEISSLEDDSDRIREGLGRDSGGIPEGLGRFSGRRLCATQETLVTTRRRIHTGSIFAAVGERDRFLGRPKRCWRTKSCCVTRAEFALARHGR